MYYKTKKGSVHSITCQSSTEGGGCWEV